MGRGIMLDHASALVIGGTAVVGDDVYMLHKVRASSWIYARHGGAFANATAMDVRCQETGVAPWCQRGAFSSWAGTWLGGPIRSLSLMHSRVSCHDR
jgi:hypothetical protein